MNATLPDSRLYRLEDGIYCDVSPANVGKAKPRCVVSAALAAKLIISGVYRIETSDEHGASVLVWK